MSELVIVTTIYISATVYSVSMCIYSSIVIPLVIMVYLRVKRMLVSLLHVSPVCQDPFQSKRRLGAGGAPSKSVLSTGFCYNPFVNQVFVAFSPQPPKLVGAY